MRSGNPALSADVFDQFEASANDRFDVATPVDTMTIGGTTVKTGVLLGLATLTAGFTWQMAVGGGNATPWIFGGAIVGLIFALITIFKPTAAPWSAPIYALAEGFFLGGISAMYASVYEGIVVQAVLLTFGIMFAMLVAFGTGMVQVTERFRAGIVAATGGIMLVYLVSIVMNMFGSGVPYIHGSGMIGIGFSLFVVIIASLNLVLDFDFIQKGSDAGAPKYMEWYGAFGLMVTLVWLYIEILRLLAKLNSRD